MHVYSFDWSGADTNATRLRNIACFGGDSGATPTLRRPPNAINWTRSAVVDFLAATAVAAARGTEQQIVGIDCPFSFPWAATAEQFATGQRERHALWEHVHAIVWPAAGVAQTLVDAYQRLFAQNGNVGADYADPPHFRRCEQAARNAGSHAKSVYNLRGVSPGKGAICGIAVLYELTLRCCRTRTPLVIWPFFRVDTNGDIISLGLGEAPLAGAPAGCLVVVETYPRVFWNVSHQDLDQYDDPATWDAVRAHFNNGGPNAVLPCNTDQADALVAWYGMSALGAAANLLAPSQAMLDADHANPQAVQQEGWIIGI